MGDATGLQRCPASASCRTSQRPAPPSFVAGGGSSFQYSAAPQRDDNRGYDRNQNYTPHEAPRQNFVMAEPANDEPEYATFEEAEAAFLKMLKRIGVQPDWNWQQVMKTTITDPQYRALKDPKERKVAFDKFVAEAEAQDKEREKERVEKIKEDFTKMLKSHPEIKHYTRWKMARPTIEGETIFRSARDDTERRQLYEDYIVSLKKANVENQAAQRKAALDAMTTVLSESELEPYSRWADAQDMINKNQRFNNDDKFRTLSKAEVLTAFQNHIKGLERLFNDQRQTHKLQKARRERINRDKHTSLLRELKTGSKIKAGMRWMDVQPLIEDDERYTAMLGQTGSTPLDLFWDACEEEERVLRKKRNEVLDVLDVG